MKVIVFGSGGREHAICWALAKSPLVKDILCVPGNGGTQSEKKCRNIIPSSDGIEDLVQIAQSENPEFVVIGPENPLCEGLADRLWDCGIATVGPKAAAAALEGSKDYSKRFMHKHNIACATSTTVTNATDAHAYISKYGAPIVVKADGLAAGKGVVVATTLEQAHAAIDDFMTEATLGEAGKKLVLEEYLCGTEISVLAAVSVTAQTAEAGTAEIIPFVSARDHKRLLDDAQGPNTGGMGAVAPVSDVAAEQMAQFDETILKPTLQGFIAEKIDYRGFIFFGVMLTKDGPKLLEYNVRLGDPETQAVLPLMESDFAELCLAIIDAEHKGLLQNCKLLWKEGFVCAPVVVSGGYPVAYKKGYPISIDEKICTKIENSCDIKLFVAGAQATQSGSDSPLVTSGGRVLAMSAYGKTFDEAWQKAYKSLEGIHFDDMFYRKDIGLPGAAESKDL